MEQRIEFEQMIHQMCVNLIMIIHLSMNWDAWGSKRLKYWDILQDNVASAAYTDKLSRWLTTICNKMSIGTPGRKEEDRNALLDIMSAGHDKAMLRHLREATQLCVLEVRVTQQEKKEARELQEKIGQAKEEYEKEFGVPADKPSVVDLFAETEAAQ